MKIYALLILVALSLTGVTSYLAFSHGENEEASLVEREKIHGIIQKFTDKNKAIIGIDLNSLYPSQSFFQLFQLTNFVGDFSLNHIEASTEKDCGFSFDQNMSVTLDKEKIWKSFRCNKISFLLDDFFKTPPFMHESGHSYAFMYENLIFDSARKNEWIKENAIYFHVLELKKLNPSLLDSNLKFISALSSSNIKSILRNDPIVLDEKFVGFKSLKHQSFVYQFYPANEFDLYLKSHGYFLNISPKDALCYYQNGEICLSANQSNFKKIVNRYIYFYSVGTVSIIVLVLVTLFSKIKRQKIEEERKNHALRVLTHELRTPIANLILEINRLNKNNINRDDDTLEGLMHIESEIYRLKRLAEKSASYLKSNSDKNIIQLNNVEVTDMNVIFEDLLLSYKNNIEFEIETTSHQFGIDLYWLEIIVKNLIENALQYGKKPITVKVKISNSALVCIIEDSGSLHVKSFNDLLSDVKKNGSKQGLGLGLNIVNNVIKEMKGEIWLESNPTRFTIKIWNKHG